MSKEKAELKISIYQEEIEEYTKKAEQIKDQIITWKGYARAMNEVRASYNELFHQINLAHKWNKLSTKEQEKEKPENKPKIEMTDAQCAIVSQNIKPILESISVKYQKALIEPDKFAAKADAYHGAIIRLTNLIEYQKGQIEKSGLFAGESTDKLDDKKVSKTNKKKATRSTNKGK